MSPARRCYFFIKIGTDNALAIRQEVIAVEREIGHLGRLATIDRNLPKAPPSGAVGAIIDCARIGGTERSVIIGISERELLFLARVEIQPEDVRRLTFSHLAVHNVMSIRCSLESPLQVWTRNQLFLP